jgi:hypothetical protein
MVQNGIVNEHSKVDSPDYRVLDSLTLQVKYKLKACDSIYYFRRKIWSAYENLVEMH